MLMFGLTRQIHQNGSPKCKQILCQEVSELVLIHGGVPLEIKDRKWVNKILNTTSKTGTR